MSKGYLSPGVGYTEEEILPSLRGPNSLSVGIVGTAKKGPMGLTEIREVAQLYEVFGYPQEGQHGLYAAEDVLANSNRVIYKRVATKNLEKGTAGDPSTDVLVFRTKTGDSTMNGFEVVVMVDVDDNLTITLNNDRGKMLESLTGFSLDPSKDNYVEVAYNNYSKYLVVEQTDVEIVGYEGGTFEITGGNDGIEGLTTKDITGEGNSGLKSFYDTDNVDIATLIVPGWSSEDDVITELDKITRHRGDILVPIDPPKGLNPTQVKDWVNAENAYSEGTKLNNEFFAVYYPWITRRDPKSQKRVTLPPSGVVASQFAKVDSSSSPWLAVAGLERGLLNRVTGLEYELSKGERDLLYSGEGVINPITEFKGTGYVLFGNRTSLRNPPYGPDSARSYVNVRRLSNYIKKLVIDISLTELFNPNDRFTWTSWKLKIDPKLREIQEGRGIEEYRIEMDESTVSLEDINTGRMPGTISIRPTRATEFIPITFVITSDDVLFSEDE